MIFSKGKRVAWPRLFTIGVALILAVMLWVAAMMVAAAPGTSAPQTKTVYVSATQPWTNTGLTVHHYDQVEFQASGRIKIAGSDPGKTPDGDLRCTASDKFVAPGFTCYSLIARWGNPSNIHEVGTYAFLGVYPADGPGGPSGWGSTTSTFPTIQGTGLQPYV